MTIFDPRSSLSHQSNVTGYVGKCTSDAMGVFIKLL